MQSTYAENAPSLILDRPQQSLAADSLGRKGFVRSFWKALRNHEATESFVIGIQAAWGDGKTSFKNMVVSLEADEGGNDRLVFVHFNPWEWSGQNQVSDAFFRELGAQTWGQTKTEKNRATAQVLRKSLQKLNGVLKLGKAVGASAAAALSAYNPDAAAFVVAANVAVETAQKGVDMAVEGFDDASLSSPPSIETVKKETRGAFESYRNETGRNIVVIIDDIDRLAPQEILQVLQLVKVNADFPGLIFVLLYDRSYVERCLQRQFGGDRSHFLEKIVQFELSLLPPPEGAMLQALANGMRQCLTGRVRYLSLLNVDRIKRVFDTWLHLHITNPRKFSRLLSTWSFHLGVFDSPAPEVNPVDLLILDSLSLFEPKVYRQLHWCHSELFPDDYVEMLDEIQRPSNGPTGPSRRMQALNRIAAFAANRNTMPMVEALKILMGVDGNDFSEVDQAEDDRRRVELRFCHPEFFRRYFRLSIDAGDVPNAVVDKLAGLISLPGQLFALFDELERDGILLDALDGLLAVPKKAFGESNVFVAFLLDWWEKRLFLAVNDQDRGTFLSELKHRMIRLYHQSLGLVSGEERLRIITNALSESSAVFTAITVAFSEAQRRHFRVNREYQDGWGILEEDGVKRVNALAASSLLKHFETFAPTARIHELDSVFWTCGHADDLRKAIGSELIKTPGGAVTILMATIGRVIAANEMPEANGVAAIIARLVSVKRLAKAVSKIGSSASSIHPNAASAATALDRLVKGKL